MRTAQIRVMFSVSERNGGTGNREVGKGRQARQAPAALIESETAQQPGGTGGFISLGQSERLARP
ncbi:hypothetical protein SEA_BEUFFERT_259 [Streptomyces phage Beuffert]|nr:hypothetical protein SEA_BEUFFERT_259 [Streptomyces phage Beuffert]